MTTGTTTGQKKDTYDFLKPETLNEQQKSALKTAGYDTKEEGNFILDFLSQYGYGPSAQQRAQWANNQDRSQWEYAPASAMYSSGFRTPEEYRYAQTQDESFGPWSGSSVPEGGIVTTDEFGRPKARYMDVNQGFALRDIAQGRYINPPGGLPPELEALLGGNVSQPVQPYREGADPGAFSPDVGAPSADVYPNYNMEPYKPPSLEEAMANANPNDVYTARLKDYVTASTGALNREKQSISDYMNSLTDELDTEVRAGRLTLEQAQERLDLTAKEKNVRIRDINNQLATLKEATGQAQGLIGKGYSGKDLPFFAESQSEGEIVPGPEFDKLRGQVFTQATESAKKAREAQIAGIPRFTGYNRQGNNITGQEKSQFMGYVQNLSVAPEYQDWLFGQYGNLFNMWSRGIMNKPFLAWLQDYLAGTEE